MTKDFLTETLIMAAYPQSAAATPVAISAGGTLRIAGNWSTPKGNSLQTYARVAVTGTGIGAAASEVEISGGYNTSPNPVSTAGTNSTAMDSSNVNLPQNNLKLVEQAADTAYTDFQFSCSGGLANPDYNAEYQQWVLGGQVGTPPQGYLTFQPIITIVNTSSIALEVYVISAVNVHQLLFNNPVAANNDETSAAATTVWSYMANKELLLPDTTTLAPQ